MKYHQVLLDGIEHALMAIFYEDRFADKVIEKALKGNSKWGSRDRRFFAETVYDLVRHFRRYSILATEKDFPNDKLVAADLRAIISQYLLEKYGEAPQRYGGEDDEENVVSIERPQVSLRPEQGLSFPDWLWKLGLDRFGESAWSKMAKGLNEPAPVFLRANVLKGKVETLQKQLADQGVEAFLVKDAPHALKLGERRNVFQLPEFRSGLFEVQDGGSQMIAPFVGPLPGQRIIDACAGGGGKSLHLAALMQNKGKIISMDIYDWKLHELQLRARRNGVHIVETRVIESTKVIKRLAESADAVLLDVPCSGLGVLRRNPDAKWKVSPEKIEHLRETQKSILKSYSRMVKPKGHLVYATCSILPEENHEQVESFLGENPEWQLVEQRTLVPGETEFDGFYMAKMQRQ